MRDGRRNRLGLVDGTEGTVQDTYIDRILSDVDVAGEPNILSLDPDANVRTTDQRYLSDAYNYYLGGGYDAAQDDFPIQAEDITGTTTTGGVDTGLTDFEQNLIDQGGGVQAEPGAPISAPGEGMLTQEAIDELADYPIKNVAEFPTGDAELASQIAAEDRAAQALADEQADEQALINLEQARTGQSDLPVETYIGGEKTLEDAGAGIDDMYATDYQGGEPLSFDDKYESIEDIEKANFPYGINPTTGEPYQTPRTIEDQKRILGVVSEQDTSESLYQKAKDYLGEKTAGAIDWTSLAVKGLVNNYVGRPVTLLFDALGAMDIPGGPTFQTQKAIELGLVEPGKTQDIYGINTQSQLGNYDKYNVDRVEQLEDIVADQLSRGLTNTIQMRELEDRREYVDRSGASGDIQPDATDLDIATGVLTGDAAGAEQAYADIDKEKSLDNLSDVYSNIGQTRDQDIDTTGKLPGEMTEAEYLATEVAKLPDEGPTMMEEYYGVDLTSEERISKATGIPVEDIKLAGLATETLKQLALNAMTGGSMAVKNLVLDKIKTELAGKALKKGLEETGVIKKEKTLEEILEEQGYEVEDEPEPTFTPTGADIHGGTGDNTGMNQGGGQSAAGAGGGSQQAKSGGSSPSGGWGGGWGWSKGGIVELLK